MLLSTAMSILALEHLKGYFDAYQINVYIMIGKYIEVSDIC